METQCLICNQSDSIMKDIFKTSSKHSNTPLFGFIERFTRVNLRELENTDICTRCVEELNNYDQSEVACKRIQKCIVHLFKGNVKNNNGWDSVDIDLNEFKYKDEVNVNPKRRRDSDSNNIDKKKIRIKTEILEDINEDSENCSEQSRSRDEERRVFVQDMFPNIEIKAIDEEYNVDQFNRKDQHQLREAFHDSYVDNLSRQYQQTDKVGRCLLHCPNCTRTYKDATHLHGHLKYECGKEPQFLCTLCTKRFHRKKNLTKHMLSHSSPEPLKCPTCPRSYKHSSSLATHLKYECGNEPQFQCVICLKKYKRKSSLQTHMGLHSRKITSDHN